MHKIIQTFTITRHFIAVSHLQSHYLRLDLCPAGNFVMIVGKNLWMLFWLILDTFGHFFCIGWLLLMHYTKNFIQGSVGSQVLWKSRKNTVTRSYGIPYYTFMENWNLNNSLMGIKLLVWELAWKICILQ